MGKLTEFVSEQCEGKGTGAICLIFDKKGRISHEATK
jgi:hypothetical protein